MALTIRSLAALTLSLATSAALASAQAPIVPGHGPGQGQSARITVGSADGSFGVDAQVNLSFGERRGRSQTRQSARRSHRRSVIQPRRGSTCTPRRSHRVVQRRVWIPGYTKQVYHAAQYDYVTDACGFTRRVLVRAAHYDDVWVPGHYQIRSY
tara:strand:- start:1110 stop:1571 length:462 start_codon:yes stop_codon:yes gene_type:complete